MLKYMTATLAAVALTVTSFAATPAQAEMDRGEKLRLLLGLGALGALVVANERNKDRRNDNNYSSRGRAPVIDVTPGYGRGKHGKGRARALPARCETAVPTRRGTRTYFGQPCLDRAGYRAALPRQCAATLDFGRRQVTAFEERCLRRHGYRVRG